MTMHAQTSILSMNDTPNWVTLQIYLILTIVCITIYTHTYNIIYLSTHNFFLPQSIVLHAWDPVRCWHAYMHACFMDDSCYILILIRIAWIIQTFMWHA